MDKRPRLRRDYMSNTLNMTFTVPGTPVPKGRPRFTRTGHVYTPKRTRQYEARIQAYALVERSQQKQKVATGPVVIELEIRGGRGDTDNILKAVKDACNGILWEDDRQVCDERAYRADGEPGITLTAREQ